MSLAMHPIDHWPSNAFNQPHENRRPLGTVHLDPRRKEERTNWACLHPVGRDGITAKHRLQLLTVSIHSELEQNFAFFKIKIQETDTVVFQIDVNHRMYTNVWSTHFISFVE